MYSYYHILSTIKNFNRKVWALFYTSSLKFLNSHPYGQELYCQVEMKWNVPLIFLLAMSVFLDKSTDQIRSISYLVVIQHQKSEMLCLEVKLVLSTELIMLICHHKEFQSLQSALCLSWSCDQLLYTRRQFTFEKIC